MDSINRTLSSDESLLKFCNLISRSTHGNTVFSKYDKNLTSEADVIDELKNHPAKFKQFLSEIFVLGTKSLCVEILVFAKRWLETHVKPNVAFYTRNMEIPSYSRRILEF